jgi:nucleotide-binding universal stress UspA family protein
MVSLALDRSNEARLEAAGRIAELFEAVIVGIAASQFSSPLYFTSGERAQDLIDQGQASIKKRLAELQAQFHAAMKHRGRPVEWRSAIDFPARFVLQHARSADIIVSGPGRGTFSDPLAFAGPQDLVMQAGRPLLLVPDTVDRFEWRSILVAWKDTPEARRAIVDALPLLQRASDVTVAEIPEQGDGRSAALSRLRDVVAWLSRHGIAASEFVPDFDENRHAPAQLDGIAAEVGANIVVAGAYGHSRFREWILGGMTEHLMTRSNRCVLLSH